MKTYVARGFAALPLSQSQFEQVVGFESTLPDDRYLMPFEIGSFCKVNLAKEISPTDEGIMRKVWIDFCKARDYDQEIGIGNHVVASQWMHWARTYYPSALPSLSSMKCGVVVFALAALWI